MPSPPSIVGLLLLWSWVLLRPCVRGVLRAGQSEAPRGRAQLSAAGADRGAAVPARSDASGAAERRAAGVERAGSTCYYWRHLGETDAEGLPNVGLMVPLCNVLAYLLGPVALAEPPWVAVGATVAAVLLLTARQELHGFARRIELGEIVNAGRFLLLTGICAATAAGYAGDRPDADHAASGVARDGRGLHGVVRELPAATLCGAAGGWAAGGAAGRALLLDRDDAGAGAADARRTCPRCGRPRRGSCSPPR